MQAVSLPKWMLISIVLIAILLGLELIYITYDWHYQQTPPEDVYENPNYELVLNDVDKRCLALTLYHEARGEPFVGQLAVAEVVLNRMESKQFPDTVCGVVQQSNKKACQFSWWCDGKSDAPANLDAWERAQEISEIAVQRQSSLIDLTEGSLFYHSVKVNPSWSSSFKRVARIGQHIFYRPRQQQVVMN